MNKNFIFLSALATIIMVGCSDNKVKQRESVKVKTTEVQMVSVGTEQSYSGTIEEMNGTLLSFASMGTIKTLNINDGQFVRAGQLLGTLDPTSTSNAVSAAASTKTQTQDALVQAQDAYKRMKQLHDADALPEIKWVEVQTKLRQAKAAVRQATSAEHIASKGYGDTRLTAPFSGYISQKSAEVGQNASPGLPVAKLVKIDQVKVKIAVPEEEIKRFHKGQHIIVRVPAFGKEWFTGVVAETGVSADVISHSYDVKAIISNPQHRLLPGMICEVYVPESNGGNVISLPADIVQIDADNKAFVWIDDKGKAKKVVVEIGNNAGDNVEITSGLSVGDKVIVEGQQKISTGMRISE